MPHAKGGGGAPRALRGRAASGRQGKKAGAAPARVGQSTLRARRILTSVVGRSVASVCTFPSRLTTAMPLQMRPKIVCLPSSHGVGARVM
jgi:hypothetical protein